MTETSERIKATTELITRDPLTVTLTRNTAVTDSYGGATETTASVTAQTMRLSQLPRPTIVVGDNGESVQASAMLIGAYNANIKAGDTFTSCGHTYKVVAVRAYAWRYEADLEKI